MRTAGELLLAFVALYPVCTAALWTAGGLLFRVLEEPASAEEPEGGWPGLSVLIPAYNEESVIAVSVAAALAADYPELEVLVLDDGSTDDTEAAAQQAAGTDPRCRVIRDPVNRGKADRLNFGFQEARHELVAVVDADTHLHPAAPKLLVARICRSPMVAAVAGAPHVTNRGRLLLAMQVLEAAAIIGLIRRTQSLTGRVGVVAGVLGLFRRDRVLDVGGLDPRMATEDIDLTWKLMLAGWETVYEPHALVGMQVPSTLRALWAQRTRWARGQGEVLHVHLRDVTRWRHHRMWLLALESLASLIWVVALAASLVITALGIALGGEDLFGFALAWGVAMAAVAMFQLIVALSLEHAYDPTTLRTFLLAGPYPLAYWIISAAAALRAQTVALLRGPRKQRVVWDIPREPLETGLGGIEDAASQDRRRHHARSR
jgi:poly-beta-1,6-N-acetyl-D-glucosamine synthase